MRFLIFSLVMALFSPAHATLNDTQKTALLEAIQNGDLDVLNHISVDSEVQKQSESGLVQNAQYRGLFDNSCGESYPGQDYYTGKRKPKLVKPPKRYFY